MKLLRFGTTVINMDRVNSIEFNHAGGYALLYHSAPHTPNGIESLMADFTKLEGADMNALERWLLINSEDMTPATVDDGDGHDFRA